MNAVSIDNQKRIIEKSNRSEPVVRTDLLLMKPDDFIYLCEKYDCNVTPYLISELGKTAAERSAFLQLQKSTPKFRGFINHSLFLAFKIRITIKNEMISKSFYPTFRDHFNYIIQPLRIEY